LHIAQQMPLPLTISCSSKSRVVLTFLVLPFWYLLTRVVLDIFRRAVKWLCVCVCVRMTCTVLQMRVYLIRLIMCSWLLKRRIHGWSGKLHVFYMLNYCPIYSFSVLMLLVGQQEGHSSCKNCLCCFSAKFGITGCCFLLFKMSDTVKWSLYEHFKCFSSDNKVVGNL